MPNVDNLTKFIWVKNYTKTYKKRQIISTTRENTSIYARRLYGKNPRRMGKNPPNNSSKTRDGYIRQACTQLGLTRLADFATSTSTKQCVCSLWTSLQRGQSSPQRSTRRRRRASRVTSPWRFAPSSDRRGESSTTSGCPSADPRFWSTRLTSVSSSPSPSSRAGASKASAGPGTSPSGPTSSPRAE